LGAVGLDWEDAGFGPMHGPGTSDMVLRNVNPVSSKRAARRSAVNDIAFLDPQVCG